MSSTDMQKMMTTLQSMHEMMTGAKKPPKSAPALVERKPGVVYAKP